MFYGRYKLGLSELYLSIILQLLINTDNTRKSYSLEKVFNTKLFKENKPTVCEQCTLYTP